ncbi:hypothetical protein KDA00_05825 [Candidatus Saccharibacteria bacterium]|nr:hypothetical protein [Candidatus Saccharibacteria bacterium]
MKLNKQCTLDLIQKGVITASYDSEGYISIGFMKEVKTDQKLNEIPKCGRIKKKTLRAWANKGYLTCEAKDETIVVSLGCPPEGCVPCPPNC